MLKVKELYERVNNFSSSLDKRYPEVALSKSKKGRQPNILFMSPMLNKQGLYRMIFPSLELNANGNFNCIITNIIPEDPTKSIDNFNVPVKPELIQWADYVVFPTTTQRLNRIMADIKKLNPNVKVFMDVDRNYHKINPNNYLFSRYKPYMRQIEDNMLYADAVLFPDRMVEMYYQTLLQNKIKRAIIVPNLLSRFMLDGIDFNGKRELEGVDPNKKKILIMCEQDDYDDLNFFRDMIDNLTLNIPSAEVVVFGNYLTFNEKNPLKYTRYTQIKYQDMFTYYQLLHKINADVAVVPLKREVFYRPYYKLLELCSFGYPVFTMNAYPFNHLLQKDVSVFINPQKKSLVNNVDRMLDDKSERMRIMDNAQKHVFKEFAWFNSKMLEIYYNVFTV